MLTLSAALFGAFAAMIASAQAASDPPTQVHSAFAGGDGGASSAPDGFSVMWATMNSTSTSMLRYGKGGDLSNTVHGTQKLFWKTWLHTAEVTGLEADTEYSYQVGDATAGWSAVFTFTTAPSSTTREFTIGVLADMGINHEFEEGYPTRQLLADWVASNDIEWTLHAGDISYADDFMLVDPLYMGYEDIWNRYQTVMENVTAPKAYMVCPGNHEAECHSPACDLEKGAAAAFNNFSAYNARFHMPSAESGGVENMWWSMAYGAASFIFIDSETDFPGAPGDDYNLRPNGNFGDQLKWFRTALERANATRSTRPWLIVSGHRPLYSLDACDDSGVPVGAAADFQKAFEALMIEFAVDLYVAGHVHGSEVSYPTKNNVPVQKNWNNPAAPTYVIVGGAGNIEGLTDYTHDPQNVPWNAYVNGKEEVLCKLTLNPSKLTLDFFISQTGQKDYSLVIQK